MTAHEADHRTERRGRAARQGRLRSPWSRSPISPGRSPRSRSSRPKGSS